jgi:hypothetical protein
MSRSTPKPTFNRNAGQCQRVHRLAMRAEFVYAERLSAGLATQLNGSILS